jgi:hypothetical protein
LILFGNQRWFEKKHGKIMEKYEKNMGKTWENNGKHGFPMVGGSLGINH